MRTLLLLGLASLGHAVAAGEPEPVSERRDAMMAEFRYVPPLPGGSPGAELPPTQEIVDGAVMMPAFHVAELRPRVVRDLQHQWGVQERLQVKAAVVKDLGRVQLVLLQPPGIVPLPLGAGLSIPVLSLRW